VGKLTGLELTLGVTFAVLGAALLHATWNAILKSGSDPLLDTGLVAFAGTAVALPFALFVDPPESAAWPYLAASVAVHMGYYAALAGAYKAGDLSHGYPIMRGVAPLLVAAASWLWFGEALSLTAWAGVLLICGGVLSLGLAGGGATGKATAWALFSALIIAVYTLADGAGVRVSGGTGRYLVWLFVFMGLPFGLVVLAARRGAFLRHAARHWPRAIAAALLSGLSYGIALWAMTVAPVAVIAALRETSVIFAALIGAWFLKEGHFRERLSGAAIVLAGLVALKL
jgi:drug/metabolite transporter (DMT)-like permease